MLQTILDFVLSVLAFALLAGLVVYVTRAFNAETERMASFYGQALDRMASNNGQSLTKMAEVLESQADRLMSKSVYEVPRPGGAPLPRPDLGPEDGFEAMRRAGLNPDLLEDRDKWYDRLEQGKG